jgi:hypothetical protein
MTKNKVNLVDQEDKEKTVNTRDIKLRNKMTNKSNWL